MDIQIILFGLWVALMLTFLLGDVIRLFAGDMKPGELMGKKATQVQWLMIALMMVTPIVMAILSLLFPDGINRTLNLVFAALWFIFNAVGLPSYSGWYDRFLLTVGLGINALIIWYAWNWAV